MRVPDELNTFLLETKGVEKRLDRREPLALDRGRFEQLSHCRVTQWGTVHRLKDGREAYADKSVPTGLPKLDA